LYYEMYLPEEYYGHLGYSGVHIWQDRGYNI